MNIIISHKQYKHRSPYCRKASTSNFSAANSAANDLAETMVNLFVCAALRLLKNFTSSKDRHFS